MKHLDMRVEDCDSCPCLHEIEWPYEATTHTCTYDPTGYRDVDFPCETFPDWCPLPDAPKRSKT